jgi:hypothetical protein
MRSRLGLVLAASLLVPALPVLAAGPALVPTDAPAVASSLVADLGPAVGEPYTAARAALAGSAARLGVDAAAFRFETVRTSPLGTHVRGRAFVGGVPVAGSAALVTLADGRVRQVVAHTSALSGAPSAAAVTEAAAVAAATEHLGTAAPLRTSAERLLVERAGRLADTWRVAVVSLAPAVAATVDVDAASGDVVDVVAREQFVDGTAKLFDPNPIVTSQDLTLRQPLERQQAVDADLDSAALTAARVDLPMLGLDEAALTSGRLSGPHVNVLAAGYNVVTRNVFDYTRGDPRFEGAMAYAHVDAIQRYFQSLGLSDVNNEAQEVVAVRVEGFDNSFYQPGNDLMLLGTGGVDDGEDAEVIVHEYGHAVHDAQVPGWGETLEGGAMGEGFGDFLAAAYYGRDASRGFNDTCVMEWDATSYADGPQTCLRRLDTGKRYPQDVEKQVHADGEIWSDFLWRVRDGLGETSQDKSDRSLRLLLSSHELLTPRADFAAAVQALRDAALMLGRPEWEKLVVAEAKATGFPVR